MHPQSGSIRIAVASEETPFVTEPWMKQLYGNPGITNLDTISYIKTCLLYLKSLKDCPLLVLTTCTDIFGIDLDKETDVIP